MKQLLDPISTMCKLVSLNFMETSSKISIHNHVLNIQQPNDYQFFIRFYNGDSKENISELFHVILRLIKWYLTKNNIDPDTKTNYTDIAQSDEFVKMIKYTCCGFNKLQDTYKNGNVVFALQYFIDILTAGLTNVFDETKLPPVLMQNINSNDNLLDYEKIKNFWPLDRLKKICALYDNCFTIYFDEKLEQSVKNGLINSYLKSVFAILDMIDKEFQTLINNCDNG